MSGRKVILSLTGTQSSGPEQERIEVLCEADMRQDGSVTELVYDEPDETGLEETVTTIRAEGDKTVSITRTGKHSSQLFLEKGKRHLNHYETGYGPIVMGIHTSSIRNTLSPLGGILQAEYTLEMNHSLVSNNRFVLKIVEVKHADHQS